MQERVYKTKVRDIEDLRQPILNAWDELDQRSIDASVHHQWRARLRAPVTAEGEQFEQKL
jgi:hypothetical protein